jgi:FlaA1/EpsC-like NDP-sugar epimerase
MKANPLPQRVLIVALPETAGWACDALAAHAGAEVVGVALVGQVLPTIASAAQVIGSVGEIPALHQRHGFDTVVVTVPRAMQDVLTQIRADCEDLGVSMRVLPSVQDVLSGPSRFDTPADTASLIGRGSRSFDPEGVSHLIRSKRVLITGAGGSIGSELARLCAQADPERLILMDRSENALFDIERELARRSVHTPTRAVLHDIVDPGATLARFEQLKPQVIFHAAAHKHVPMMEDHPVAAVRNNIIGSRSVADAAREVYAERFVMISTDKAVNPTSIMGATKLLAERYIQSLPQASPTRFAVVRFGNVIGSACSVLPIWQRQLSEGGPLTITHPDMTRYFMTIPEAAALVIRAADIQEDTNAADVFVLDMGEPVRIVDLAERFVRSQGLEPRWDDAMTKKASIRLTITGIRPGEKIHEQLAHDHDLLTPTRVPGVLRYDVKPEAAGETASIVEELGSAARIGEASSLLGLVSHHVPTLTYSDRDQVSAA